jgi:hypothetical protein
LDLTSRFPKIQPSVKCTMMKKLQEISLKSTLSVFRENIEGK